MSRWPRSQTNARTRRHETDETIAVYTYTHAKRTVLNDSDQGFGLADLPERVLVLAQLFN